MRLQCSNEHGVDSMKKIAANDSGRSQPHSGSRTYGIRAFGSKQGPVALRSGFGRASAPLYGAVGTQ